MLMLQDIDSLEALQKRIVLEANLKHRQFPQIDSLRASSLGGGSSFPPPAPHPQESLPAGYQIDRYRDIVKQ